MFNKAIHSTSLSPPSSPPLAFAHFYLIKIDKNLTLSRLVFPPFFFSIGYDAKCWIQQFFYLPIQWENSENIEILIAHSSDAFCVSVHHFASQATKIEISIFSQFNQHSSQNIYFYLEFCQKKTRREKIWQWNLEMFFRDRPKKRIAVKIKINKFECMFEQGTFICV